jgi:hypothetical protein
VHFDTALCDELAATLPDAPILDTGAGHDAGVLVIHVPTAMPFVRTQQASRNRRLNTWKRATPRRHSSFE